MNPQNFPLFLRWMIVATLVNCLGCGDKQELPEEITKMRPVGVQNTPVVGIPGETGTAFVYVATPIGQTVTALTAPPENIRFPVIGIPSVSVDATQTSTQNFSALALHKLKISFSIPGLDILKLGLPNDFRRLRYAVTVTAADKSTTIVNDIYVFAAESPEATTARDLAEVNISLPSESVAKDSEIDIKGELTKNNYDASFKYGWFTSKGSIKNRRARETKWKTPPEAGTYTLIFTAHGRKVRSFALMAKDVTVQ